MEKPLRLVSLKEGQGTDTDASFLHKWIWDVMWQFKLWHSHYLRNFCHETYPHQPSIRRAKQCRKGDGSTEGEEWKLAAPTQPASLGIIQGQKHNKTVLLWWGKIQANKVQEELLVWGCKGKVQKNAQEANDRIFDLLGWFYIYL